MDIKELARLFYLQILKIHRLPADHLERNSRLYLLLNRLFYEFTKEENLQFTTSFARITYGCLKFKLDPDLQWRIHHFRKLAQRVYYKNGSVTEAEYQAGIKVLAECTEQILDLTIPDAVSELFPSSDVFIKIPSQIIGHLDSVRMVILGHDEKNHCLLGKEENNNQEELIKIKYSETGRNDLFDTTIEAINEHWKNQTTVNLLDVFIEEDGTYVPSVFVLEPDYLLDVTAISETFQSFGTVPFLYILKKFLPMSTSIPLMLGNIANYFLDELLQNPEADFKAVFPGCFQLNPVAFCLFDDLEIRQIMHDSKIHFDNLKSVITNQFPVQKIDPAFSYLEPGFYSERYGIQGRLDVLYNPDGKSDYAIVELKSGKPYQPNRFGLSRNHYVQTLLYDLLIKSAYGGDIESANYILYSKIADQNLKFAPPLEIQQKEAMKIRNELVALEQQLSSVDQHENEPTIIDYLDPKNFKNISGFARGDLYRFSETIQKLTVLERKYFLAFSSFIAREHRLAKTGEEGTDTVNGLASLWLNKLKDKEDNFDILSHLEIADNQARASNPILILKRTEKTTELANFRQGDIAVLYPSSREEDNVLNNQIFKCSITRIDKTHVEVRLRSQQYNDFLFKHEPYWCIEKDLLDSSFSTLYRNMYRFIRFPNDKKQLLLTTRPPKQCPTEAFKLPTKLSSEQQQILGEAIAAEDYYLLVGPPGTGKTKFMLRELVHYLYFMTNESVMLLAYTNRAVDEICEAISDFADDKYIRIGSEFSTGKQYHHRLFKVLTAKSKSRAAMKEIIESHRIYVSTVSSINGKKDLFKLKQFNRVIIDEASQILEPMLVGLLPLFNQFVLIGDHKQLPAVVMQKKQISKVNDEALHQIGLKNRKNSLFERLYARCLENNWHWAIGMLTYQGRMHEEIAAFPNQLFYDHKLQPLPLEVQPDNWQRLPLQYDKSLETNELTKLMSSNRMVHFSSPVDDITQSNKTNIHEAKWAGQLVLYFKQLYEQNNLPFDSSTIGIITPYRAQIAQIKDVLEGLDPSFEAITVDTVERYQGGAREIILLSLCLNDYFQMNSLVSLSDDGVVDRKLNVALTRARKHMVILGNRGIMNMHPIYKSLVDFLKEKKTSIDFPSKMTQL